MLRFYIYFANERIDQKLSEDIEEENIIKIQLWLQIKMLIQNASWFQPKRLAMLLAHNIQNHSRQYNTNVGQAIQDDSSDPELSSLLSAARWRCIFRCDRILSRR